ncbi:MAG: NADH-quinone oxidoreductase subunit K [Ketobacteraceae bacterium]|nr:NADH-quinone oxidoreductase subunit K [Ketobacteraceae bacterium]
MSDAYVFLVAAILLFAMGMAGVIASDNHFRRVLAINIASAGLFMLLLALAHRDLPMGLDPVPQAMVLTGIVVSVAFSALALRLIVLTAKHSDSADPQASDQTSHSTQRH